MKEYTDLYLAVETGLVDNYDFIGELKNISPKQLSLEDVSSAFYSIICDEISGMSDIIHSLVSKEYRICLFSDTSKLHLYDSLNKPSFAHLITGGGGCSFETGALKPDDMKMFM